MKTVTLSADWLPRADFVPGKRDMEGVRTYSASKVWRNPRLEVAGKPLPTVDE